ncbi:ATP-dependent DNA helicase RecQ-like [Montipora foliosa]|uniref:ATP-dependent DNA helicase RecQ-like n=1 Tax=Montipora foliosa TaxID=591990 RepID=UPI0035F175FF
MADSDDFICKAWENFSLHSKSPLNLRLEQRQAVEALLQGRNVLAVLPTGYGKSLIFRVYVAASALKKKEHQTVLVVCLLRSIIDDQIEEAKGMGMSASSLSDVTDDELRSAKFQLLFAPAEEVINNRFLEILKEDGTALHRNLAAVVVDESHTVETWTGKRSDGKRNAAAIAFREAFGKLSTLRSFCKQGSPILALSATADGQTQSVIIKELEMKEVKKFYVSPNWPNLSLSPRPPTNPERELARRLHPGQSFSLSISQVC